MAPKDPFVVVKKKRKHFKWSDNMIENLVYCISNYKIKYYFKNRFWYIVQKKELRESMAKFSEIYTSYSDFRSISAKSFKMIDEELKVCKHKVSFEKDLINNGYQSVL